jgi:hypothetical protein
MSAPTDSDIFDKKYDEFANELKDVFPECLSAIQAALNLSKEDRKSQFQSQVLPSCSPSRNPNSRPEFLLPGVSISDTLWSSLSDSSKHAIQEYLTLLSFCLMMQGHSKSDGWTSEWATKMMDDMKTKMKDVDFSGFAEKFSKLFGSDGKSMPQIPEKFLKGQIARLAEEIVNEFRISDFGLDPAALESAGDDPTKALSMIMEVFMKNPQSFQTVIAKIGNRLKQKVESGSLRPQELVAEAEELMKTFSENPQFVDMMETFRQMFGGADEFADQQRSAGRDGNARLSIVQARLRKKLEAKKGNQKKL